MKKSQHSSFLSILIARFRRIRERLFPHSGKKTVRRRVGDAGEKFAASFLKREAGMKILCRNFCFGRDEIDLVARERDILVFVEVKTRSESDLRGAVYAVDVRKKRALRRAAKAYVRGLREAPKEIRLDVVEVYVSVTGEMRAVHHRALPW